MSSIHTDGIWYPGQKTSQLGRLSRELCMFVGSSKIIFEYLVDHKKNSKDHVCEIFMKWMNRNKKYREDVLANFLNGKYEMKWETMDDTMPGRYIKVLKYPRGDELCREGVIPLSKKIWRHQGDPLWPKSKTNKPFKLEKEWSNAFQQMEQNWKHGQPAWKNHVAEFYCVMQFLKYLAETRLFDKDEKQVLLQTYNATKQYWDHLEDSEEWKDVPVTIDMDVMHKDAAPPPSTPPSTDNPYWVHL